MNRLLLGLATIGAVAFATSCASDPTGSLSGSPSSVVTTISFFNLNVGDSVLVNAETRDAQGVVLPAVPEVSSNTPSVVTVNEVEGGPLSQTSFYIKGVGFGEGTVTASSGGASATVTVQTFPANVGITGMTDTLGSGTTVQLAPDPQDVGGNSITADTIYTWSTSDASILSVDSTGLVSAAAPGTAEITVTAPAGGGAGGATATISMTVVPGSFDGALSAGSGAPGDAIVITPGSVAWDGDEGVLIDGDPGVVLDASTTSLTVGVPPLAAGTYSLVVTNQGPTQIAGETTIDIAGTYTVNAFPGADITAGAFPRNFYAVVDDVNLDEYFQFNPVADLDVTVTLSWAGGADIDILWRLCDDSGFVGNFDGASSANPEVSSVTIPAGACWTLILDNYSGDAATLLGINITSP